jgi:ribosomal protein L30E
VTRRHKVQRKKTCHVFSSCCDQGHDGTADRSAANPKENIMKTLLTVVAIALSTLTAGQALASGSAPSKTRAEVKAELAEAVRSGNMIAHGDSGATLKELYPHRYAQQPAHPGKTRAEVQAELAEAIRSGNMITNSERGATLKELYPHRYSQKTVVIGKTRAEVKAELVKAVRSGNAIIGGERGATFRHNFPGLNAQRS